MSGKQIYMFYLYMKKKPLLLPHGYSERKEERELGRAGWRGEEDTQAR